MVNQKKGHQGKKHVLALMVIITLAATVASQQRRWQKQQHQDDDGGGEDDNGVSMTSEGSRRMPWVVQGRDSRSQPLGIAESPKASRTLMLQSVMEEPRKESCQTESQCRQGKETSSENKDKDSEYRSREKDKELRRHFSAPVRDVKCKHSSEGITSSSKRRRFHCYTCKTIIYLEQEEATTTPIALPGTQKSLAS